MGCICEHCGAKCSILLRSAFFHFLHVLGTLGCEVAGKDIRMRLCLARIGPEAGLGSLQSKKAYVP